MPKYYEISNNAQGNLVANITDSTTSFSLGSGEGASFPSISTGEEFIISVYNNQDPSLATVREDMRVTARSGDSFTTVVRGFGGTTPESFSEGDFVSLNIRSEHINKIIDAVDSVESDITDIEGDITAIKDRTITAGNGLTGGGDLSQNRTITLGNPGTLTGSTNNTATSNSHTHAVNLNKGDVGLGNVDNTSDATKNSAAATLTNKTLTSPVINNPTGIVKADVGLSNVDNTSDANKPVSSAQQTALNGKVGTTGNETISGVKTFSSAPILDSLTANRFVELNGSKAVASTKTIPNGDVVGTTATQTLSSKRLNPRVTSTTSGGTTSANVANSDMIVVTALAVNTTLASPTGTPVQGQKLLYRIKDNGTSRTLSYNAIFRAIGVTLPTSTTPNKTLYIGCVYNSTDTKWDIIAVANES
jgi:hypothetical protein